MPIDAISARPEIYTLSPLIHNKGEYTEAFIKASDEGIISIEFI